MEVKALRENDCSDGGWLRQRARPGSRASCSSFFSSGTSVGGHLSSNGRCRDLIHHWRATRERQAHVARHIY